MLHQRRAQSQVRPFIGDGHGDFTFMFSSGGVAADADFDQLPVFVFQRDISGALLVVGVHQLVEQGGAGFTDL